MSLKFIALLIAVCVFQNMVFTFVSRARQSGDPKRHVVASIFSNGVWFFVNYGAIFPVMWEAIHKGDNKTIIFLGIVYALSCTLGAYIMHKISLGHWNVPYLSEKGKAKVGER